MITANRLAMLCILVAGLQNVSTAQTNIKFQWPQGKEAAISLSFDDARFSQVDRGTALLDSMHVRATFYLVPSTAEQRLDGWKRAVGAGHEMGNHSLYHP